MEHRYGYFTSVVVSVVGLLHSEGTLCCQAYTSVVASRTTKYENYLETVGFESYTFTASVSHAINLYTNILKRRGLIAHMVPLTQLGAKHTEGVK